MKNQTLVSKLHKPVHPTAGKAVLGTGILLAVGALVLLFLRQLVSFPLSTPPILATPTLQYSEIPDKLQVSRSVSAPIQRHINPQPWSKSIDSPAVVQRLYNAILALPPYPTPNPALHVVSHCFNNYTKALYELNFFKNDKLVRHGTMTIAGCSGGESISLDGTYKREFYYGRDTYQAFMMLLENSFGMNESQLYGKD